MNTKYSLFDLTTTYNKQLGWHSANPSLLAKLTKAGYTNITAQILTKMDRDYAEFGYQTQSYSSRLYGRLWAAKFNVDTKCICLLVGDWLSDLARKVIPSALADGVTILLVHTSGKAGTFRPVCPRQSEETAGQYILSAYQVFQSVEDWLAEIRTDAQTLKDLQADCNRLIATAAALGIFPESKGPITGAYQLRKILPPLEEMTEVVENWGPLYDIEMPHVLFVQQYETTAQVRQDSLKHMRPDLTVRYTRNHQVQVEDQTELIICYMQIRWYQEHHIAPVYVWCIEDMPAYTADAVEDDEDYTPQRSRKDCVPVFTRRLPKEAAQIGLQYKLNRANF